MICARVGSCVSADLNREKNRCATSNLPAWIAGTIALLVSWIVLERHRWGRELYAIGGNEEAARLSGLPVALSKTLAYASLRAS